MLVLARRKGQELVIARAIKLVVLEVRGSTVKLGITAPDDVTVDRYEVYLAKQADRGDTSSREQQGSDVCTPLPQVEDIPDLMPSWTPII
jgi:carbon storage regulator